MKNIYKINKKQIKVSNNRILNLLLLCLLILNFSCDNNEACEYGKVLDCPVLELNKGDACDSNGDSTNDGTVNDFCECIQNPPIIPQSCNLNAELNLSTGIDASGNQIPAPTSSTDGVEDPSWRILNKPVLTSCGFASDGKAYTVNLQNSGPSAWVNQTGATTISFLNSGNGNPGTCANPRNENGEYIPYIFERSFCVLEDTMIDFDFTSKGDNFLYFELINNNTNTSISTSSVFDWSSTPTLNWSETNLSITRGSYSIRAYLTNAQSWTGFSFLGNLTTTNGDNAISNNVDGCCENNVISVLNILDNDCSDTYSNGDAFGKDWSVNLKDSSNTIIKTVTVDINGNAFFSGLVDGTYTVEVVNQAGFTSPSSISVTVASNQVEIVEFFNCKI